MCKSLAQSVNGFMKSTPGCPFSTFLKLKTTNYFFQFFSYKKSSRECNLKFSMTGAVADSDALSGPKYCNKNQSKNFHIHCCKMEIQGKIFFYLLPVSKIWLVEHFLIRQGIFFFHKIVKKSFGINLIRNLRSC